MITENLIEKLFSLLDDWRKLPSYQLERRSDIFFALYLHDIFQKKFHTDIEHIIPEFPIRKGSIKSNKNKNLSNRSFKIDFVAVSEKTNTVYFIELKTDDNSRNKKQDDNLKDAKAANMKSLIDGVLEINKTTKSKKKYKNLLKLLAEVGWLDESLRINNAHDYNIEIVYIQPNPKQSDSSNISFNEVIDYLSERNDILTKRFVKSLKEWEKSPN